MCRWKVSGLTRGGGLEGRRPVANSSVFVCPADGSAGGRGAPEPAGRPRVLQHPARAGGRRRGALQDHRVPARGPHHADGERRARGQQGQDHLHHQRQEVGHLGSLCPFTPVPHRPTQPAGSFFAQILLRGSLSTSHFNKGFCSWGSDHKKPKDFPL